MKRDRIRVDHVIDTVEAAYALDGENEAWLERVVASAHRDFDLGHGTYGFTCRLAPDGLDVSGTFVARELDPRFGALIDELNRDAPADALGKLARTASGCDGFADFYGEDHPATQSFRRVAGPHGFRDGVSLFGQDGEGWLVDVTAPSSHPIHMHARVRSIWRRVALHVASGFRLRRKIAHGAIPDALIAPNGTPYHLEADVRDDRPARAALMAAARGIERARLSTRDDPARALELWQGLVAGRWSLVDHWERGGKRYLAAFRNAPELLDPRALTAQESSIARYVSLGASNKEIAFTLGLPLTSVASAVGSLLRKLSCRHRSELVALGPPSGWNLTSVALDDGQLDLVEVDVLPDDPRLADLTSAEREVAARVLSGDSNEEIAKKRGSSVNTVANQLRAIYRKLGVEGRLQLVSRFARGRDLAHSDPMLPTTGTSRPRSSDVSAQRAPRLPPRPRSKTPFTGGNIS